MMDAAQNAAISLQFGFLPRRKVLLRLLAERLSGPSWALQNSFLAGWVVIVDYLLRTHKGGRVEKLIESRDCELVFLPPTRRISPAH